MTVQEIIDFLSNYSSDLPVTMVQYESSNPMTEDVGISEIVAITRSCGEQPVLVIIPD